MSVKVWGGGVNARWREVVDGKDVLKLLGIFPNAESIVRTGQQNPYYRDQILRGENAATPMTLDAFEVSFDRGFTSVYSHDPWPYGSNSHRMENYGDVFPNFSIHLYDLTAQWELERKQEASLVFLKRLREADRKFQAGVFFGEIVPTLRMLVRPFGSLRDGIKNYYHAVHKRGRGSKGAKLQKILGDTWLEFSFGWRPFQNDIKDAAGAAIDIYANLRKERVKAEKTDGYETATLEVLSQTNQIFYQIWGLKGSEYSVKYYGKLDPLPNSEAGIPYLERIRLQSNFDWSAFIPTAWELIPYSFLIDYFSNVGNVLQAYATDTSELRWVNSVEWRRSWKQKDYRHDTFRQQVYSTGYLPGQEVIPPPVAQWSLEGHGGATTISRTQITRMTFVGLEYPGLRFELPMKANQFANMAALLAGSRKYRG